MRVGEPQRRLAFLFAVLLVAARLTAPGAVWGQVPPDGGVAAAGRVVPPSLVRRAQPIYPRGADGLRVDVELLLTLDDRGTVIQTEVLGHVPAEARSAFDDAARDAARTLQFEPARQDGVAIPVRLRFRMAITPPEVALETGASDAATPPPTAPETEHQDAGAQGASHAHVDAATPPSDAAVEPGATVVGHAVEPSRGAGDFNTEIGPGLRQVPRANASDLLRLAPGILLTNEGGEGHAEQVYLRGFDAHEGQDLEFTVNGVPINEVGNPHGEGLVDTHFIIPELVRSIRVLEGPFDPHQGNYAVAGSADYELGLDQHGLSLQYLGGSFNTHRALALWAPEGPRSATFLGADLRTTDGFGSNRAARLGRAMGQWEASLGPTATVRILATSYVTQYGSAGVVRQDDFDAGRIDFFGSYDPTQGGDAARHGLSVTLQGARPERTARLQVFGTLRNFRLRENYTGFLEDPPAAFRSGVAQRGDEVDQTESATTVGARASVRQRTQWRNLTQSIEVGFYGRFDAVDAAQRRLRFGTVTPYRVDFDLTDAIGNTGLYLDAEVRLWRWLVVRGGVRGDYFAYDVLSRCDLHDTTLTSAVPVLDTLCYSRDRSGPRDPTARRSASGLAVQPRATAVVGPFAGFAFTASVGTGSRSADPSYLSDSSFAPFASLFATEAGVVFNRVFGGATLNVRALFYYTYVDRDLIFNQQEGRNSLAPGTRRQGALVAGRLSGRWFDWAASATFADARFVRADMDPGSTYFPADQGDRVPYVPTFVVRSDAGVYGPLRRLRVAGTPLVGRAGLGVTYVSPRSLPYGEQSDAMLVVDASAHLRWRWLELGVIAQNLFDSRYQLGVYNYVSNFNPGTATPDLLPRRHFAPGAPLGVFGTLTLYFGSAGGSA